MYKLLLSFFLVLPLFAQDCGQDCQRRPIKIRPQTTSTTPDDVAAFYNAPNRRLARSVDDRTFLRRTSLDLTGRLPSPQEVTSFLADTNPNKRAAFIDQKLQSEDYAARWSSLMEDLFESTPFSGSGLFINSFEAYWRRHLRENTPYDQVIREMLTVTGPYGPENPIYPYVKDLFNSDIRLDVVDDKISHFSRSLLGIDLNCISCHDGAYHLEDVNKGLSVATREQFWGMAAFLAEAYYYYVPDPDLEDEPEGFFLELQVHDYFEALENPDLGYPGGAFGYALGVYDADTIPGEGMRTARTGGVISPNYMFGGGTMEEGENARQALARLITADRQFARNFVNRVWSHFFGEGFVERLDGWDLGRIDEETAASFGTSVQARNDALMEHLTDTFIQSNYDIKALIRLITNSSLYQADHKKIQTNPDEGLGYWYSGIRTRRLQAEALVDAIRDSLGQEMLYTSMGRAREPVSSTWHLPRGYGPNAGATVFPEYIDPVELGFTDLDSYIDIQSTTAQLLEAFGRPVPYETPFRNNQSNLKAVLNGLNNEDSLGFLDDIQKAPYLVELSNELASNLNYEQTIEKLYHHFLFRDPSDQERELSAGYLQQGDPESKLSVIAWALMNHPDFWHK